MRAVCFRLTCPETVQFFQIDDAGNIFVFAPGAGCTGTPHHVEPGDEMIFNYSQEFSQDLKCMDMPTPAFECITQEVQPQISSTQHSRTFTVPLQNDILDDLKHMNFAPDTMKKIQCVTKMYRDWREYRHSFLDKQRITCDLDDKSTITKESLIFALSHFLTEVKKVDGSDFPGKTLYEILICMQFHLECIGFAWKLVNDEAFKDIKYTLDNVMKIRASQGVGKSGKKAQIL